MSEEQAVIVAAVSSDEQVGEKLPSLDEQEAACRDYCERVGDAIVECIRIEGHSRSYSRLDKLCQDSPDYRHLIDLMETGAVTKVVVENYHRLWRTAALQTQVCTLADESGVWLYSLRQPSERGAEQSNLWLRGIFGLSAQQEIMDLTGKHRRGMQGRVHKGLPICSSRRPYGYQVQGRGKERTVVPVAHERRGVAFIMERRSWGWGYGRIGMAAYDEGWRNPNRADGRWTDRAISYICHNPLYAGYVRFSPKSGYRKASRRQSAKVRRRKEEPVIVKGQHEALISEELWQAVQRVNGSQTREYTYGNDRRHLFAGLAKCGFCGDGMAYRKRQGHDNLCCARYQRHGGPKSERRPDSCQYNGYRVDTLRAIVLAEVRAVLNDPDAWAEAQRRRTRANDRQERIRLLEGEVTSTDAQRGRLVRAIEMGEPGHDRPEFIARYDALSERRNLQAAELERLRQADERIEDTRRQMHSLQEALARLDTLDDERLRPILTALIDRIVLRHGEPPEVRFRG